MAGLQVVGAVLCLAAVVTAAAVPRNESYAPAQAARDLLQKHPDLRGNEQPPFQTGAVFPCDTSLHARSAEKPTSVNKLTFGDIDVVAAIGDSITKAFAAKSSTIFGVALTDEYPGVSWSIGGDGSFSSLISLPNAIKEYNPNVYGASTGKASVGQYPPTLHFNFALSGAKARGMPKQARSLIEGLQNSASVDYENDWKMITVWIGGNDFCQMCEDDSGESQPSQFAAFIEETLDILAQIPRVYINLVGPIDVTELKDVGGFVCDLIQSVACPCTTKSASVLLDLERAVRETSLLLETLAQKEKYHTDTVEVQLQPFFELTHVPTTSKGDVDMSYFAPDCFHFTTKAQQAAATGLWNNINHCPAEKRREWHVSEPFECPTTPYLPTHANCQ